MTNTTLMLPSCFSDEVAVCSAATSLVTKDTRLQETQSLDSCWIH